MTVQTLPAQYPDWATAPAPGDVTESDAARKASGWLYLDRPPHDEFNWWWQRVAQWVRYTEERLPWGWWPSAVLSHGGVNVSGAGTGVDVGAGEIVVAGRVLHRNATPTGAITPDGVWESRVSPGAWEEFYCAEQPPDFALIFLYSAQHPTVAVLTVEVLG